MSPGLLSTTVPSSITVLTLGERISEVCETWQLSVFSRFTCLSQLHPGSSVTVAILKPPRFTSSIFSSSQVMVSSGESRFSFVFLIPVRLRYESV
jgi:hypothetical protein